MSDLGKKLNWQNCTQLSWDLGAAHKAREECSSRGTWAPRIKRVKNAFTRETSALSRRLSGLVMPRT